MTRVGSYHVVDVSHHFLRRRARKRAFDYDRQGGGRDAVVQRAVRGPFRWRVEYRRYDTAMAFGSSKR